jgi:outer membrane immunogenic protein
MKKLLLGLSLSLLASTAFAADAIVEEVAVDVAPGFTWTGGYIGAQVGYLWGDGEFSNQDGDYADPAPDGWLGGVYVGYNYQFTNNVVLGIDADFAWTGADDQPTFFDAGGVPQGVDEIELGWEGAARLRLGYAVDRFLPYIAGGVAFGQLETANQFEETNVGWTLGAGLEYAFTDNLIGRAEYRYTDFGDFETNNNGFIFGTDLTTNDVRLGIAYKF